MRFPFLYWVYKTLSVYSSLQFGFPVPNDLDGWDDETISDYKPIGNTPKRIHE